MGLGLWGGVMCEGCRVGSDVALELGSRPWFTRGVAAAVGWGRVRGVEWHSFVTCSCASAEPVPTRTTRPLAMASCVDGELIESVESADAAASLTSATPVVSSVTSCPQVSK